MYTTKKNTINNIWGQDASIHTEKLELPPPPPVPPHHSTPTIPPRTLLQPNELSSSTITTTSLQTSPLPSSLMRCTSLPHTSSNNLTTVDIPQRPVSWHPIPSRRTSRFYQEDPEIKAKLDRIVQSDRLLSLRARHL